mmetsp:Transcript_99122/g.308936  ORF Transcript_99122/g.308936 Transcript_99122/m.308936 type:complete len:327 (+) Transcript_99122:91-1071(+)
MGAPTARDMAVCACSYPFICINATMCLNSLLVDAYQPRPRPLPLPFPLAFALAAALAPSTAAMTSTPSTFSTSAATSQQLSARPVNCTSSSGRSSASMKPLPGFAAAPNMPPPASNFTSTQFLTTVTSVPSSTNLMEFLPSSCFASFRTSTPPWPPASRMAALPPGTGLPTTCFSLMKPRFIFSLGHWHSSHWSSIVTSMPFAKRPAMFFAFVSFVGAFLTITNRAPLAQLTATLALASGTFSLTSPLTTVLASLDSWPRSFRGTLSLMWTCPWASGSKATSVRSSGISMPRSLASGAQRSATFFLCASGTLAKYWQSNFCFRLLW